MLDTPSPTRDRLAELGEIIDAANEARQERINLIRRLAAVEPWLSHADIAQAAGVARQFVTKTLAGVSRLSLGIEPTLRAAVGEFLEGYSVAQHETWHQRRYTPDELRIIIPTAERGGVKPVIIAELREALAVARPSHDEATRPERPGSRQRPRRL